MARGSTPSQGRTVRSEFTDNTTGLNAREKERHKEVANTMIDQLNTLARKYNMFGIRAFTNKFVFSPMENGDTHLDFKITAPGKGWNVGLTYRYGQDVYDLKVVDTRGRKTVFDEKAIDVGAMFDHIMDVTHYRNAPDTE